MRANRKSGKWGLKTLLLTTALALPAAAQSSSFFAIAPPERVVVVSIPDRKLVVIEHERAIASFSVAVGAAESPSPAGEFRIINRVTNPAYYRPGTVIGSGKDNPIGTRWLGLSRKG